jgi:hypothetical protein
MKMRLILTLALCAPTLAIAEDVTVETFVRAESDYNIRSQMEAFGYALGELHHLRDPIAPDNQPTIRMNQDTLYSALCWTCQSRWRSLCPKSTAAISPCMWSVRITTCLPNPSPGPTR